MRRMLARGMDAGRRAPSAPARWSLACALAFAGGCRALNATEAPDAAAAADGGPVQSEPAPEPPSRLEPPVVRPTSDIVVDTVAGSATRGGADGAGAAAQFDNPVGVLFDPAGALLVTEYDGGRLRKIDGVGATSTIATGLREPFALVAIDDALIVQTDVDRNGAKGADTGTLWKIALAGGAPEVLLEGLGRPRGLARLGDGRVVFSDRNRHRLSILNLVDRTVAPLAGSGTAGFRGGRGEQAQFDDPYGLALLPDGSVVVADRLNHVIRKVTLEGDVTVFAGDGNPGMKDDADKLLARFDEPVDVASDVAGNVFVSDSRNGRIRRIGSDGSVETIAGDGTRGFADGDGATARFYGQEQLDVSPDGKTVYVSDGNGGDGEDFHRIRRIRVP